MGRMSAKRGGAKSPKPTKFLASQAARRIKKAKTKADRSDAGGVMRWEEGPQKEKTVK